MFSRHARKHFSQAEGSQLDEVRQVMGMLAFPPDTHISPYKVTCARGPRGLRGSGPSSLAQSRSPARPSRPFSIASPFCFRELGSEELSVVWPAGTCLVSACHLLPHLIRVPGPCPSSSLPDRLFPFGTVDRLRMFQIPKSCSSGRTVRLGGTPVVSCSPVNKHSRSRCTFSSEAVQAGLHGCRPGPVPPTGRRPLLPVTGPPASSATDGLSHPFSTFT